MLVSKKILNQREEKVRAKDAQHCQQKAEEKFQGTLDGIFNDRFNRHWIPSSLIEVY